MYMPVLSYDDNGFNEDILIVSTWK